MAVLFSVFPVIGSNASGRFNMSYIYFGTPGDYYMHVDNTRNSLNEVSPNYFNIDCSGNLELTEAIDTNFVNEMQNRGIKVVPFLSNHWDREKGIKALANRHSLSDQIVSSIVMYNLDGVNVDIENVTHLQREYYTDFVRLLREKMPEGKTLAVAVAPNPYGITTGWHGSYDYKSLAKYSDYLMIMAYDESYPGGPAGPVASYDFVEATIIKALTEVPKDKIVLGIPFYGRYWKTGEASGGAGLSVVEIEKLIKKCSGNVIFDTKAKSPKAIITIGTDNKDPDIRLTPGTYTFWYENEASIKQKLKLVNKYDLKGTGSWSLGQETTGTWYYYNMWLNGYYFADVQGHWAQPFIISTAEKGWMIGISSVSFAPDKPLTRAEAAAILVRALELNKTGTDKSYFTDISGHWAENDILTAAQNGVVLGIGNGRFCPDELITRQELAVMLDRILPGADYNDNLRNPFSDISRNKNPWSYDSIVKLYHNGIFSGNPDGTFNPAGAALRAQMAVLMEKITVYF
jgi:spore germination protein YaaH